MDVIVIESNKEISQGSEILKLMASLAILLGSIYVFYTYSDLSVLIRTLLIIFSVVVATFIFFTTHRGSIFWSFLQGSRVEMRKVVKKVHEEGEKAKEHYFDRRQHIQKIVLNSMYGVLGLPVFRFYDLDNAEAVSYTHLTLPTILLV